VSKNRINKNDRKRQLRKDFSHGRDWSPAAQDQRSPYPKSSLTLRANADRRAAIAGIRTKLPAATWRTINAGPSVNQIDIEAIDIDLSPGALNYVKGPNQALMDIMRWMNDKMMSQMLYGVDLAAPPRPNLQREMKVGEILAYRCWRLSEGLLRSVYMHDYWEPKEIMSAREIEDWSERGIHAWKDLNSREFNEYVRGYLEISSNPRKAPRDVRPVVIVTGTVLLWGDVVEHEHGYRAEYARINSIDWLYPDAKLMGRERETLNELRNLYGVS
jgi:hypothetical protein